MKKFSAFSGAVALCGLVSAGCVGPARPTADWPRWGGNDPGRNMYSPATGLPDHFASTDNARVRFKPGTEEIETNNLPNLKWIAKVGSQSYGNLVVSGGKVYCGDEDGDFVVFAASKEMKILSRVNLGAPVYSTPIVANGVLYVRSNTHLFAFCNRDKTPCRGDQKPAVNLDLNPANK